MAVKIVGAHEELNMSEDRKEGRVKRKIQSVFWKETKILRVMFKVSKNFWFLDLPAIGLGYVGWDFILQISPYILSIILKR